MRKSNSIGIFCIILGTALADSPSLIPTVSLILTGSAVLVGAKICADLDY